MGRLPRCEKTGVYQQIRESQKTKEMQLSKKVADWYSKYLIDVVDEKPIKEFKECLTDILYSRSCYHDSHILISGYGDLGRLERDLEKNFGLPKGTFPEDIIMFILFEENKAYYKSTLSEKEFI